jgi:hypothetical protein
VFYVVAGPCIQTMVVKGEKGKRSEVLFPATALEHTKGQSSALRLNPRPTIERMPRQPASHALPSPSSLLSLSHEISKAITSDQARLP